MENRTENRKTSITVTGGGFLLVMIVSYLVIAPFYKVWMAEIDRRVAVKHAQAAIINSSGVRQSIKVLRAAAQESWATIDFNEEKGISYKLSPIPSTQEPERKKRRK